MSWYPTRFRIGRKPLRSIHEDLSVLSTLDIVLFSNDSQQQSVESCTDSYSLSQSRFDPSRPIRCEKRGVSRIACLFVSRLDHEQWSLSRVVAFVRKPRYVGRISDTLFDAPSNKLGRTGNFHHSSPPSYNHLTACQQGLSVISYFYLGLRPTSCCWDSRDSPCFAVRTESKLFPWRVNLLLVETRHSFSRGDETKVILQTEQDSATSCFDNSFNRFITRRFIQRTLLRKSLSGRKYGLSPFFSMPDQMRANG